MFATIFWGLVMVVVADLYVLSSSLANAFNYVVNAEAIAFTIFYIFTALATTWYYRDRCAAALSIWCWSASFPWAGQPS